jgi:hypothetical protein
VTLVNWIAHALIISENQRRGKPRGIRPVLLSFEKLMSHFLPIPRQIGRVDACP